MKETPFTRMLRAYGIDLMHLPDDTSVTNAPGGLGIWVETFCLDNEGLPLIDELKGDTVTRNVFHPHP